MGPRYTSRPLPPYRHIPGRTPHPTRDPDGHSHGQKTADLPDLNTHPWADCPHYLYGIDLFNEGYWWECHEVLEGLWISAGIGTPAGHALQAIIQCAAAHLKTLTGQLSGGRRLVEHARKHVQWADGRRLGMDLAALIEHSAALLDGSRSRPARIELDHRAPEK
jgi:hypothetical protein